MRPDLSSGTGLVERHRRRRGGRSIAREESGMALEMLDREALLKQRESSVSC
jgi:hypothetical protein